ncbi:hypothetical protein PR003_g19296 [Phytophthora rubi]|uniref:Uncharacterized protein n=1 Tax=Phytophthora rubi TaxID=129364 RepID=A0A6A4DU04_9STRA|nr:hypothetical protein PR003_g19296 [Phytophthora rubi]
MRCSESSVATSPAWRCIAVRYEHRDDALPGSAVLRVGCMPSESEAIRHGASVYVLDDRFPPLHASNESCSLQRRSRSCHAAAASSLLESRNDRLDPRTNQLLDQPLQAQ